MHRRAAADPARIEPRTQQIGRELLADARRFADRQGLSQRLIDWATEDPDFKTHLFRFVDVLPVLRDPDEIHRHLVEYLLDSGVNLPAPLGWGLRNAGILKTALARATAGQVTAMARRFIAGNDIAEALPRLRKRWDHAIAFSVDLLGEACLGESEAAAYRDLYLRAIESLADETARWPAHPVLDSDHLGPVPRANVSIKITSLAARIDPIDHDRTVDRLADSLDPILLAAAHRNVTVNFDMEHRQLKDLTLDLFMRCCERRDFPAALALQAYLRSADDDAARLIDFAHRSARRFTLRLVKGAYWDQEVILAEQRGWPVPVWTRKHDTDACFERIARALLAAAPRSAGEPGPLLALGSHNVRSIAHTLAAAEQLDLPPSAVEFQMLYGMAGGLKLAAAQRNLRVREYVPVGRMIPGMAYLVRRLLENTSNDSWLRAGFFSDAPVDQLLAPPPQSPAPPPRPGDPGRHQLSPAVAELEGAAPFLNEPHRDFSIAAQRLAFAKAVEHTTVQPVANDTTVEQADAAISAAVAAFDSWRSLDPIERGRIILAAADLMRQHRDELSAVIIRESGKPWRDADADVCEAIDFCRFYARCAVPLLTPVRLGRFFGEHDQLHHEPRGPAAVISPWNFPLAITAGMTVAALVTGNPVLLKPAEQSPAIAARLCEILWRCGVPRDALHFLPGDGPTLGAALVRDPRIAVIAFTGSRQVGLDIIQAAALTPPGQPHVKRVICEMGGKNAVIVDSSADPDEAVVAVRESAFSYAGQKCSACSRLILLDAIHDDFLARLVEATRALVLGDPADPATDVPHLIDDQAAEKVRRYIEIGHTEGRCELAVTPNPALQRRVGRPFVGPHIFSAIGPDHRLAREEVFGPVLAVLRARDFDHALELALATDYRLTGGLLSRTPSHIEAARRRFRVGNLYINRAITGALVARQPFGGFGLSGGGTKAGSADYLREFVLPRTITENTLRRGFAPDLEH